MSDKGRSTRAYISGYARARVHQSRLYRFERRRIIADFNGLLQPAQKIKCVTWRTDAPEIGVISDAQITADARETSVLFASQLGGWASIRVDATAETGEIYTQVYRVNVREASGFFDDPPTQSGPFSLTVCTPPDGEVIMSAYQVLERRSTTLGTYTPNGDWTDTGEAFSAAAGLAAGLAMQAVVCTETRGNGLSVLVSGRDANENPIQETITLLPGTMFRIGDVQFFTITSIQVLASPAGSDGFFSVGARIRTVVSGTGFDRVTFNGAVDANLQLVVSVTERTLDGPLSPFTPTGIVGQQYRINFAGLGFTDVLLFVVRTANSAARTINLTGSPAAEIVVLSGQSVQTTGTFTALDAVIVTAGTSVAPFAAVGASYRAPV